MATEVFIICVFLWILFSPIVSAKTEEIRERARQLEIENDEKEDEKFHRDYVNSGHE